LNGNGVTALGRDAEQRLGRVDGEAGEVIEGVGPGLGLALRLALTSTSGAAQALASRTTAARAALRSIDLGDGTC
jgi:hypothetical protein